MHMWIITGILLLDFNPSSVQRNTKQIIKPTIRRHSQNAQETTLQHDALRFTLPFPLFPHLSPLHTFHLLVLFTGRWKVFTLEGVYIFFSNQRKFKKIKERGKNWVEETKSSSICFLEKETKAKWHEFWKRACPISHNKCKHCQCSCLYLWLLPSYLLLSGHHQFKQRVILSSYGISFVKLLMIAGKKLKRFCS